MSFLFMVTFTVGQIIHAWSKAMLVMGDKSKPPRSWGEYAAMRGADVLGEYFSGLMVSIIVWVGADFLVPAYLANADPRIKIAMCGLLGYNFNSVADKLRGWFVNQFKG